MLSTYVLYDSQTAVRYFLWGNISQALIILAMNSDTVYLQWTPAHTGVGANEVVYERARELVDRVATSTTPTRGVPCGSPARLLQYRDITLHHRLLRRHYHPHNPNSPQPKRTCFVSSRSTRYSTAYNSFPPTHPWLFQHPTCPACGAIHTRYHSLRVPCFPFSLPLPLGAGVMRPGSERSLGDFPGPGGGGGSPDRPHPLPLIPGF